jgi:uncharacterized membrane protein YeaQ/YmgE (transglycosylase-associated protein family)
MLYLLWLLFMGLIVGFVAVPLAQHFGYAYGRFGRTGDIVAVLVGSLVGAGLFAVVMGALGGAVMQEVGIVAGGLIGAVLAVIMLALFAAKAAEEEPNKQEDIA